MNSWFLVFYYHIHCWFPSQRKEKVSRAPLCGKEACTYTGKEIKGIIIKTRENWPFHLSTLWLISMKQYNIPNYINQLKTFLARPSQIQNIFIWSEAKKCKTSWETWFQEFQRKCYVSVIPINVLSFSCLHNKPTKYLNHLRKYSHSFNISKNADTIYLFFPKGTVTQRLSYLLHFCDVVN